MLRETTPPTGLTREATVRKYSAALDRITGDVGDLRVFVSPDGKLYLRVWCEPPGEGQPQAARWYEILPPQGDPAASR